MDYAKDKLKELKLLLGQINENSEGESFQAYIYKMEELLDDSGANAAHVADTIEEVLGHLRNFSEAYSLLYKKLEKIDKDSKSNYE